MHRILFVDDEPKILTGLRRMLRSQRREWEMEFAEGGVEALKWLHTAPFDVVVSDARMPGMEGAELLEAIRCEFPDTARLILSGQCSRDSVLRCAGVAHQFLNKPCSAESLVAAVKHVCIYRRRVPDPHVRSRASRVACLPSQLTVYAAFRDLVAADPIPLRPVGEAIATDVAMTMKIVQMVSSGFFGTRQPAVEVHRAVDLLGPDTIRALAAVPDSFRPRSEDEIAEDMLVEVNRHNLAVADAARRVTESMTGDRHLAVRAYLAGMLHDVSALLSLPGEGQLSDSTCTSGDESQLTGYLAALWGLPGELVHILTNYRNPGDIDETTFTPLTAVHVVHACLVSCGSGALCTPSSLDMDYLTRIDCADRLEDWRRICHDTHSNEVLQ